MMAVWVIRGGQWEEFVLEKGVCVIGFGYAQERSIADFDSREALRDHRHEFGQSIHQAASAASQQWQFAKDIKIGDMVVMPYHNGKFIAIGKIQGEYIYDEQASPPHTRKVEWQVQDVPRANFDPALKQAFANRRTISEVKLTNAESWIQQVVNAFSSEESPGDVLPPVPTPELIDDLDDTLRIPDWDEYINDLIMERVRERFREHDLEYLVARLLEAEGYTVLETRRGADGGVDILAGSGAMGLDSPKLCVQVKSGRSPVGIDVYNRLQGNVHGFGADYGLLVSLSGFKNSVQSENRRSFFQIRLWDGYELVQRLVSTYDRLPQDVRTAIPLENRLVLL